ncbi:MAG: restriction endonuclease subunit S [Rhodocyclaceae bacterium]|nr:restriction endonuclease subunit S [Rhodocyclaceae bacterium]MCA3024845.1 restriction endonuclease subunit S [Rhodocyclaceae bacterium]MCA3032329.1 restriction endonuclease subunit S [Rhodocyclaceae bacterium]MCA3037842.1 restriction endonuclease subunit S [Rhodocyclaceae bacterium]MCA3039014.1 restriction endonuclease subunit S [Rhodocyclaceae bacterium]
MTKAWQRHKLGDLLTRSGEAAQPAADAEYKEITIRLWGKGVLERGQISGAAVNGRRFIARKNQFIASRIDARNGAMGIVPESLDGALVTNDFPLFEVNQEHILPQYIGWLCRTPAFVDLCARASEGTTNRVRLKEDEFLRLEIQIPDTKEQQRIVIRIDTVEQQLQAADKLRSSIDRDIASLLAVRFQETLKQASLLPMREVAPLVRRNVQLEANQQYKELGARSFGRGLFVKPDFDADAATWEKPVWIKTGDIVFSNIKAWEGAIGVAKPEHDGFIASHRYLTAVAKPELALPEYLLYYLLSESGLTAVNEASPGTADRNRTTKQSALEAISVPVPPIAIQKQFIDLKNTIEASSKTRATQQAITDALLPALVSSLLVQ